MTQTIFRSLFIVAVIVIGGWLIFSRDKALPVETAQEAQKPVIAATFFSLSDIAAQIARDELTVVNILPAGASPHTFDVSPSTLRALEDAAVVYAIGYGFDDWVDAVIANASGEKMIVDRDVALKKLESGEVDPHYWLDPRNAKMIARTIADDLSARFPERAPTFEQNLAAYQTALDEMYAQTRAELSTRAISRLVTLHDAWYYFADAYGLDIVGTFEPSPGREPTPEYLRALIKAVRENGVQTIYTEPELGAAGLESFAKDNGLTIAELDPGEGSRIQESYLKLIRHNVSVIQNNP